jgi:uncharacterized protein YyaL (SSP411 family)
MHVNRLVHEKSPYLLQHAHNPVDWYPWGEEAFARARAENKPIFLSIGYSTCHWCHVMERESFENEAIGALLNRHFVSIKVDREERPDIDRIYMTFVQATTGSGGWPMSVWLTPELKPFFGGTYFAPDARYGRPGFSSILEQINQAWLTKRDQILASSESVIAEIARATEVRADSSVLNPDALESAFHHFRRSFDSKLGGFGSAPKFPRPVVFDFLLRYHAFSQNPEALEMTTFTLREMAKGGMYDHLGGGFHRYSVDDRWFVPHFEKMLYDQAQLASSCLEAFQITGETAFLNTFKGIFDYISRDLTHPEGAFYSAEDADSAPDPAQPNHKSEGAFYIWSQDELTQILGAQRAEWFAHYYGCEEDGNVAQDPHGEFTGRNILSEVNTLDATARRYSLAPADLERALAAMRAELLTERAKRPRPHLDDKIITAWNALMISALARGARILAAHDPDLAQKCRDSALRAASFVFKNLYDSESRTLYRRWREGERAVPGFLDDYAFFIQALLDLYEATFDSAHLQTALDFSSRLFELFEDRENGAFFSSNDAPDLVLRLKEDYDGAEPSGNSVAVLNLLRLAGYTGMTDLRDTALDALRAFAKRLMQQGPTAPLLLAAWLRDLAPSAQIVIAGPAGHPETEALLLEATRRFRPFTSIILLARDEDRDRFARWIPDLAQMTPVDGNPAAYVCQNFTCQLPVTRREDLARLLD